MKKASVVILCFVAFAFMSFIFTKEEEPRYKNLKILPKDIKKHELDSVMKQFAGSLGVKCGFCHSYNEAQKSMDFASDVKKEKNIARDMWHMTMKLNKKYFDVKDTKNLGAKLEVTCYSCHHGAKEPETKAPVKMDAPRGAGPQGAHPAGEALPQMAPGVLDSTKH